MALLLIRAQCPTTASCLSKAGNFSSSKTSRILKNLENKEFISECLNAKDRRGALFSPSPLGLKVLDAIAEEIECVNWLEQIKYYAGFCYRISSLPSLTPSRARILLALREHRFDATLCEKDIAEKLSLNQSTVAVGLRSLTETGFVEIIKNPDDARKISFLMTKKGIQVAGAIAKM